MINLFRCGLHCPRPVLFLLLLTLADFNFVAGHFVVMEHLSSKESQAGGNPPDVLTSSQNGPTLPRTVSTATVATRRRQSLALAARVRSHNGHGCADLEEGSELDTHGTDGAGLPEKDPFEISWDGDDDPLCPRSMSSGRKWIIVLIVGMGSLCV